MQTEWRWSNSLEDNLRQWLDAYKEWLAAIAELQSAKEPEIKRMWKGVETNRSAHEKWTRRMDLMNTFQPLEEGSPAVWDRMLYYGESQGEEVKKFLLALIDYNALLPKPGKESTSDLLYKGIPVPQPLLDAGERAAEQVRSVLEKTPFKRIGARHDSLIASLVVTVHAHGNVMTKQLAHQMFTGRRKASESLSKLMIPSGRWSEFGTVHGDVLRLSSDGARRAEELLKLGTPPLDKLGRADT